MASSQDKAIALKDAYVNGIMDGAVEQQAADTAQAFAQMPGQDMGDQASIMIRPQGPEFHDDGDDGIYTNPYSYGIQNTVRVGSSPDAANPGLGGRNISDATANAVGASKASPHGFRKADQTPMGLMRRQALMNKVYAGKYHRPDVF